MKRLLWVLGCLAVLDPALADVWDDVCYQNGQVTFEEAQKCIQDREDERMER